MIGRTQLTSGLRVVTEALPHLRSVALGFWVGTGSRDEPAPRAGVSHFLEHLLFKGTDDRDAAAIAEAVESGGGDMNAFTAQEITTFYLRVPDDGLAEGLDILADIVWRPALRPADVESERQVILEELHLRDDEPEDLVQDLFTEAVFPQHPIGREVIGSARTIEAMTRDEIAEFHHAHYHPSNVVVAAAGNLEHDRVVELVEAGLQHANGSRPPREPYSGEPPPRPVAVLERPTEQAHLVLGMRALRHDDPDRYTLMVLNQALGGGMSSRLFQEVRERRGLAYSVYSYRAALQDAGVLAVSAGTAPNGSTSSSTSSTGSCAASSPTAASPNTSSTRPAGTCAARLPSPWRAPAPACTESDATRSPSARCPRSTRSSPASTPWQPPTCPASWTVSSPPARTPSPSSAHSRSNASPAGRSLQP